MLVLILSDIGFVLLLDARSGVARRAGHRIRFGARRSLVFLLDCRPDLLAVDGQRLGCLDPDPGAVADDLHQVDRDVVAEHDSLVGSAGDDEHGLPPWKLRRIGIAYATLAPFTGSETPTNSGARMVE